MKVTETDFEGLKIIDLRVFEDDRGFFTERFNQKSFNDAGIHVEFVQDNHSRSIPGVIRGLHYQTNPSQGKLVGVIRGRVWDVSVDLRKNSPTFGKHFTVELSDRNGRLVWIPSGFAHGFCVLGDEPADLLYKVDALYSPSGDAGILWSDKDLGIQWPLNGRPAIVSQKDQGLPSFRQYSENPKF
jgi:dTDP-4-dehydrorhamnose 3,5-epimerase